MGICARHALSTLSSGASVQWAMVLLFTFVCVSNKYVAAFCRLNDPKLCLGTPGSLSKVSGPEASSPDTIMDMLVGGVQEVKPCTRHSGVEQRRGITFASLMGKSFPEAIVWCFEGGIFLYTNVNGTAQQFQDCDYRLVERSASSDVLPNCTGLCRPAFADLDSDGDLDIVLAHGFNLSWFKNIGTTSTPNFQRDSPLPFGAKRLWMDHVLEKRRPEKYFPIGIQLADLNGDGLQDLLVAGEEGVHLHLNNGSALRPSWNAQCSRITAIGAKEFDLFDADNDGDLDLFSATRYAAVSCFENVGSSRVPQFRDATGTADDPLRDLKPLHYYQQTPTFLAGTFGLAANEFIYINSQANVMSANMFSFDMSIKSAHYGVVSHKLLLPSPPTKFAAPVFVDLNADGFTDIAIGCESGSIIWYKRRPEFLAVAFDIVISAPGDDPFLQVNVGYMAAPAFGDLDGDGQAELVVANGHNQVRLYYNRGNASRPQFQEASGTSNPFAVVAVQLGFSATTKYKHLSGALADLNSDGLLDYIVGQWSGTVHFFKNIGTSTHPEFDLQRGAQNPFSAAVKSSSFHPWPSLEDVNGDGLLDLMIGSEADGIEVFLNTGSATAPSFDEMASNEQDPFRDARILGGYTRVSPSWTVVAGVSKGRVAAVGQTDGTVLFLRRTDIMCSKPLVCSSAGYCPVQTQVAPTCSCLSGMAGPHCSLCQPGHRFTETSSVTGAGYCMRCAAGESHPFSTAHRSNSSCLPCEAGKFHNQSDLQCTTCPPGQYQPRSGRTYCLPCAPGYFDGSGSGAAADRSNCSGCPRGRFQLELRSTSCLACPKGFYQNSTAQPLCLPCIPGKYGSTNSITQCVDCDRYTHSNRTGQSSCTECPPGKSAPSRGQSTCIACVAGKYKSASSGPCENCPKGWSRAAAEAAHRCIHCHSGRYQEIRGQALCLPCIPGTYRLNSTVCAQCPVGFFANTSRLDSCYACPPGTYTDKTQSTSCIACRAGRFGSGWALNHFCHGCPVGFFASSTRGTACSLCPTGFYSKLNGSTVCIPTPPGSVEEIECHPGHFCTGGTAAMQPCPPGKYTGQRQTVRCLECIPGQYASLDGSLRCQQCPAGYSSPKSASVSCKGCNVGTYAPVGSASCLACPVRSTSGNMTRSEEDCFCEANYWNVDSVCEDCPVHAYCAENCTAPVTRAGYWKVPWRSENQLETRLECLSASACLGPTEKEPGANATCASLHRGPLCSACYHGSYRVAGAYDCVKCHDNEALSVLFLLLGALAGFAIVVAVTKLTLADGGQAAAVDVMVAKITMNHFIIASGAATFPLRWPGSVRTLMSLMSLLSVSAVGDSAFSVDCVVRSQQIRPVQIWALLTVLIPPVVVLLAAVLLLMLLQPRHRTQNRDKQSARSPSFSVTVLVIMILGHPSICKGAFNLLSCRRIGGRSFLEADTDLSCVSSEYMVWALALGVPSLLVYGLGIPFYYFACMLHLKQAGTLHKARAVYGFLFSGYNEDCWWFELWNTTRKALFTGLTIMLTPMGPGIQAWGALLLLIACIAAFARASPYLQSWLNTLERDALATDALTLFLGLALFLNATNSTDGQSNALAVVLTLSIVGLNVWFVVRVMLALRAHSAYGRAMRRRLRHCSRTSHSADEHGKHATQVRIPAGGMNGERKGGQGPTHHIRLELPDLRWTTNPL